MHEFLFDPNESDTEEYFPLELETEEMPSVTEFWGNDEDFIDPNYFDTQEAEAVDLEPELSSDQAEAAKRFAEFFAPVPQLSRKAHERIRREIIERVRRSEVDTQEMAPVDPFDGLADFQLDSDLSLEFSINETLSLIETRTWAGPRFRPFR